MTHSPPAVIVTGWKNSGKTTLSMKIIAHFTKLGLSVASVKHAHHQFDIDTAGTDSFKHREAGARQTILVSSKRMAHLTELADTDIEPDLSDVLVKLKSADLVIVEGYKASDLPKIVCHIEDEKQNGNLFETVSNVMAVATDVENLAANFPIFSRNDIEAIAGLIQEKLNLKKLVSKP